MTARGDRRPARDPADADAVRRRQLLLFSGIAAVVLVAVAAWLGMGGGKSQAPEGGIEAEIAGPDAAERVWTRRSEARLGGIETQIRELRQEARTLRADNDRLRAKLEQDGADARDVIDRQAALIDELRRGFGAVLEGDGQRVMPGGVLSGAADRGGGLGCLERNRRPVRKRRGLVAMDRGLGVAQEVLRRQRDLPAGAYLPAGWTRPGRDRAVAARQAGEAEAGGVLAPHQVVGPAVLAEAQQHSGIGNALPVVGDGDDERRVAGRGGNLAGPDGGRGHRNADASGAGPPRILQSLREDVGQGAAIGARDPLDGALVDARADRRRGRIGRGVHAGTSIIGGEMKNAPRGVPGGAFCQSCRTASGRGAGTRESPAGPALFVLVAGAHRIEAARSLGLPQIEAVVIGADDGEYRLIEIDENLMRADLTTLDRARFLAERKKVYLDLHPDRRRGGDRRSTAAQARDPREHASWAEEAIEHILLSPRAVQRAVRIGEGIPDELARALAETPIARREGDLYRLARMSEEDQARALDTLRAGGPPPATLAALFGTAVSVRSRDPLDRIKRLWTNLDADAKSAFATWLRDTGWPDGRGED